MRFVSESEERLIPEEKKTNWARLFFGASVAYLIVKLFFFLLAAFFGRSFDLVQTADPDSVIREDGGKIPDIRYYFRNLQEETIQPAEENGWGILLAFFGPKLLAPIENSGGVAWNEFSTNAETKVWYEKEWKPICAALKVDPTAKPAFADRLSPSAFLMKYGLGGEQRGEATPSELKDADEDAFEVVEIEDANVSKEEAEFYYYEGGRRYRGRAPFLEARKLLFDLCGRPWSAEEFPTLARWLDENADLYEVVADAARRPKLACPRVVPEYPETLLEATPYDVAALLDFALKFNLRMNYRIQEGDFSGALDDFETALLIAKAIVQDPRNPSFEKLIGYGAIETTLKAPFFSSPDALFSPEERARYRDILSELTTDNFWRETLGTQSEFAFWYSAVIDSLRARRNGDGYLSEIFRQFPEDSPFRTDKVMNKTVKKADRTARKLLIKDASFLWRFKELLSDVQFMSGEEREEYLQGYMTKKRKGYGAGAASFLATTVKFLPINFNLYYNMSSAQLASCRMAIVGEALRAYQTYRGTLPPAFTVDADGRPLHSWRVLILPYLGDDAKVLYDQIRLDEPWDSEHNSQFHQAAPEVYGVAQLGKKEPRSADGTTQTVVLLGDDQFFDASGVGKDWKALVQREEGNASTKALLLERKEPICWMRPDAELNYAELNLPDTFPPDPKSAPEPDLKQANSPFGVVEEENPETAALRERFYGRGGCFLYYSGDGSVRRLLKKDSLRAWGKALAGISDEETNETNAR